MRSKLLTSYTGPIYSEIKKLPSFLFLLNAFCGSFHRWWLPKSIWRNGDVSLVLHVVDFFVRFSAITPSETYEANKPRSVQNGKKHTFKLQSNHIQMKWLLPCSLRVKSVSQRFYPMGMLFFLSFTKQNFCQYPFFFSRSMSVCRSENVHSIRLPKIVNV